MPQDHPLLHSLACTTAALTVLCSFVLPIAASPEALGDPVPIDLPASDPLRIVIPALNVNAAIEQVGKAPDGRMATPRTWQNVGWYRHGARPGDKGNAVMAGHLDTSTGPAVFWNLREIEPGDAVVVLDESGSLHSFRAQHLEAYDTDSAPLDLLFGPSGDARLNLITCEGTWDAERGRYDQRLAVFTKKE